MFKKHILDKKEGRGGGRRKATIIRITASPLFWYCRYAFGSLFTMLNALTEHRSVCLCLLYFYMFYILFVSFVTHLSFLTFFFLLYLFSAFCGREGVVFHPPRIYNSLQDCSSIPGCQTIQMRHHRSSFPAHHRVMYALSHRSDWHCREARWPVENKKWFWQTLSWVPTGHIDLLKYAFVIKRKKIQFLYLYLFSALTMFNHVELKCMHYSVYMSCQSSFYFKLIGQAWA